MQIKGKGVVYKNNYGYSFCEEQREVDGTYKKYYFPIKFRKDLELPEDKSTIEIMGFMKFYTTKEDKTNSYYFVMDYEVVEGLKTQNKEPKKYKWFVVRLEKNQEYKIEIHKATDGANIRWNIDKKFSDESYSRNFHFDCIIRKCETEEEAKKVKLEEEEKYKISTTKKEEKKEVDPFAEFGEMLSLEDDNWLE